MENHRDVGRVVSLYRYPVKSMAAEPLDHVEVSWNGLDGDRRWAFIRDGAVNSGFPWLTLRERAELWHYHPSFADPQKPNTSMVVVRTPSGQTFEVTDPTLAAELSKGARVIKQDRGVFDTMPLSLISTQSIAGLSALTGSTLEVQRFRPNLVVEASGQTTFPEDAWVGRVLRVGGMRMRIDKRDQRCPIVTINPLTNERDPAILKMIGQERQAYLGVYGSTVEPGRLAVGDIVTIEA